MLEAAAAEEASHHPEGVSLSDLARDDGRAAERQFVYSQFQEQGRAQYLITDGRWKYTYSAADEREWLFDLETDPRETHNLAGNPMAAACQRGLREALIARFEADGYTDAVEDGDWRRYGRSELPTVPDLGLLFQDVPDLQARINALGPYAREVTPPPGEAMRLLDRVKRA